MKRFLTLIAVIAACLSLSAAPKTRKPIIDRIEPLSWWVGMQTPLQLMLHGTDLARTEAIAVSPAGKGVEVGEIHRAESPNYLFVDIAIAPDAEAGTYTFTLTGSKRFKVSFNYEIATRREGSRERRSFDSSDMLYLIMPDRFANGDPSNDSVAEAPEKATYDHKDGRHGGDIQGVIDHLGYLEDLGVTALWSTPMLWDNEPWCSYHGYACADYYRIDPRYGSNELYRTMTAEAHRHGIKIVKDFVTNHCGTAHWWMEDLPFGDWINRWDEFTRSNYAMSTHSDPNASEWDKKYCTEGWFDSSMPDMNLRNDFLNRYFTQAAIWWIEWADIDGLRVDTYPYNDKEGVSKWAASVRREYPNISIVGECWFHEPDLIAYWDGASKNSDGYNSNLSMVMDFPLVDALWGALSTDNPAWGQGMIRVYNTLSHDYLYPDARNLMIFIANHDTTRSADIIDGSAAKMKLALTMLATMRGMPQMYVGDENLMRADDVKGGDGAKRVNFPGGWQNDSADWFTAEGRSQEQNDVFDHTRKLFNWRKQAEVIHNGQTLHFLTADNSYVYFRYNPTDKVMVIINGNRTPMKVDWVKYAEIVASGAQGTDMLTGRNVEVGKELTVAPESSMVIEF